MSAQPQFVRRPITVDDYHLMAEAGVFAPDERVELVEGELITMAPIGWRHAHAVNMLNRRLVLAFGERAVVSVQNPVELRPVSEPQPDLAVLHPDAWMRRATPGPGDMLLVVEVADSSFAFDRDVKLPMYARHGVAQAWLVDLTHEVIRCHRQPDAGVYTQVIERRSGDLLTLDGLPELQVAVSEIFGRN